MTYRQAHYDEPLLTEMGKKGRRGVKAFPEEGPAHECVMDELCRSSLDLPELTELEVARHYLHLSQMNFGVDSGFYPLGSCTMKYNPKILERVVDMPGSKWVHPNQEVEDIQGTLEILHEMEHYLGEIGGWDAVTLQPAAGAHGEFTALLLARAYFEERGEDRTEILLPDTAHGTNPASAAMAGFKLTQLPSDDKGETDLDALEKALSDNTAVFMITNPNTLGIFEETIMETAKMVHEAGSLLYYDGANLNAIMGRIRPGDMGFDMMHYNLHKTFATPHGGGGPGSGPVGVKSKLEPYLPVPRVVRKDDEFDLDWNKPGSIGSIKPPMGNWGVILRAYAYIRMMGAEGLREVSDMAVLASNYLRHRLNPPFKMPFKVRRMHEFVLEGDVMEGVKALDVAKGILDSGMHAPTAYFPLIVNEALMVEPTETEPKEVLDAFADHVLEMLKDPERLKQAPFNTSVRRVDMDLASKDPVFTERMLRERDARSGSQ